MLELLESLEAWHWMLLGIVLLGLEALGTGGVLVGAGVAAFVTCLVALSDVEWQVQVGVFSFLTFFFTLIYFKKLKKALQKISTTAVSKTNNKNQNELVGKLGKVITANTGQTGKIKIGNAVWEVRCKQALNVDDEVRVRSCSGSSLHVNKLV